ncbi:ribonuclease E inhibitor RraB [Rossellomorea vietnamensis]|uniref:ribonuclease E inhibitor RraB n=1 Tax=Rossellomorea vietnamensis TaxID=218284 RepID=UPI003CE74702
MRLFPKKFPNDEDGQVLKMLYKQGVDFNKPQSVDFFIGIPDSESGNALLTALRNDGFSCELEQDEETKEWTLYCYVEMLLIHEDIVNVQRRLDELSDPFGGYTDGWGVMVD